MAVHTLDNGILTVSISTLGAELQSLVDAAGHELLWQGGPEWQRRAPVLFPIVGRMPGDQLVHDGVAYPMTQHGFARDQEFAVSHLSATSALFTLASNPTTLEHFPFDFRLDIAYSLDGGRLGVKTTVRNTGDSVFSASLGEHPGFAWPLVEGLDRDSHTITFEHDEPAPIRRVDGGLLDPEAQPTPIVGNLLRLADSLFVDDAVIFDRLTSRSVRYSVPGAPAITVDFADFPLLGVWSKSPGRFICIEPWYGMAAPIGFAGEYAEKPGQFRLRPGEERVFEHGISVTAP